jgi:hypothetical protein
MCRHLLLVYEARWLQHTTHIFSFDFTGVQASMSELWLRFFFVSGFIIAISVAFLDIYNSNTDTGTVILVPEGVNISNILILQISLILVPGREGMRSSWFQR